MIVAQNSVTAVDVKSVASYIGLTYQVNVIKKVCGVNVLHCFLQYTGFAAIIPSFDFCLLADVSLDVTSPIIVYRTTRKPKNKVIQMEQRTLTERGNDTVNDFLYAI